MLSFNSAIYDALDQLLDIDTLKNIDKKVIAKKKIVEVITTEKKRDVKESVEYTENEMLLHTIMTNNFNAFYGEALNEEEQIELKSILSLTDEELKNKVSTIKESIYCKIENFLTESPDDSLKEKLDDVKKQVTDMEVSKYSFYKLNGLLKDME